MGFRLEGFRFLFLVTTLGFSGSLAAQHCPFDGAHAVVLSPATGFKAPVFLQEIDNPEAKNCLHNPGLQRLEFTPRLKETPYSAYYKKNLEQDFDFVTGNLVVVLNQTERTCLIAHQGTYRYRERKFVVRFETGGIIKEIPVNKEDVFQLCKNAGSWRRIRPLKITP